MASTLRTHTHSAPRDIEQQRSGTPPGSAETLSGSVHTVQSELSENSQNVVIANRWLALDKIGQGSFGEVFEAQDIQTGLLYAIKREPVTMRHPQLQRESSMYELLKGGPGIPKCHWYGQHEEFNCLVLDLLGPSIKEVRQNVTGFPLDIVVDLGCQMVDILHHVHSKGVIFRDMKPDNFLFGSNCRLPVIDMVKIEGNMPHYRYNTPSCRTLFEEWRKDGEPKLFIVDFGLATYWRDQATGKPIPEGKRRAKNKIGTARYASINVHYGHMHARRDDLEGLAYIILDLLLGSLPWSGVQARNSKAGWDRMRAMKRDTFMSDLCAGHPTGIVEFVEYTKKLRFAQEPDYELLKRYLRGSLPGGEFSEPTRSPFGGGTVPQDIYHREDTDQQKAATRVPEPLQRAHTESTKGFSQVQIQPDGSSTSMAKPLVWRTRDSEKRVGWYTYKHEQEPWNPQIDWDNKVPQNAPATPSWGEDLPNVSWGSKEKDTSGWGQVQTGGWSQKDAVAEQNASGWGHAKVEPATSAPPAKPSMTTEPPPWQTKHEQWPMQHDASDSWKCITADSGWGNIMEPFQQQQGWQAPSQPVTTQTWKIQDEGANDSWKQYHEGTSQHRRAPAEMKSTPRSASPKQQQQYRSARQSSPETPNPKQDLAGRWSLRKGGDGWVLMDNPTEQRSPRYRKRRENKHP